MGTNYYLTTSPCSYCGRKDPAIHIGKSSAGWNFAVDCSKYTFIELISLMFEPILTLEDEYGRHLDPEVMLSIIFERDPTNKQSLDRTGGGATWDEFDKEFS